MTDPTTTRGDTAITLFGAAGEVTGSCSLLEVDGARILVDFGLFQGDRRSERRNLELPEIDFASLDAVLVTHAHVDHCGRLPMLVQRGFGGPVFCTDLTAALLQRVLRGSARLQRIRLDEFREGRAPEAVPLWREGTPPPEASVERINGAEAGAGLDDLEPPVLYGDSEVEELLHLLQPLPLGARARISEHVSVRFGHAGHVHGAAHAIVEDDRSDKALAVFSGDVGSPHTGLLRPPDDLPPCRLLVLESTRGDRLIQDSDDPDHELAAVLDEVRSIDGTLLLPTFALGRAQTLLWRLATASRRGHLEGLLVVLDAPMAAFVLDRMREHPEQFAPGPARLLAEGTDPLWIEHVHRLHSRRQSLKHAGRRSTVVLAGSGFCDAGPILHHFQEGLPKPHVRVGLSGWHPEGSLGWGLLRNCSHARIDGEEVEVLAGMRRLEGYSGHANAEELANWASSGPSRPDAIVLNHGTDPSRTALGQRLRSLGHEHLLTPVPNERTVC